MMLGDSYHRMGDNFENQEADSYTKVVRDYPLSAHVNAAKERLTAMKRPVPQADPAAYARMKYDLENRTRVGLVHRTLGIFEGHPDVSLAAKNGTPAMQAVRPHMAGAGRTVVDPLPAGRPITR